jgi:DNA adenine methylase
LAKAEPAPAVGKVGICGVKPANRTHQKSVSEKIKQSTNGALPTPFLKWAGGKRWLVSSYTKLLNVSFERYVEPFLGGGAIFFYLSPKKALLSDLNGDLIDCYRAIKEHPAHVLKILRRHQRLHDGDYYYDERARRRRSLPERAAQFLYLNRTCWNGLYRVSLQGEFNVPIGTKNSVLLATDEFHKTSRLLQSAELRAQDFEKTLDDAGKGDFIFADPPYTVKHNFNGFLKYNENIFSWDDQRRLHNSLVAAKSRGARILLTNANHESIRELYRGFGTSEILSRISILSGDSTFRGPATEISIFADGLE